MRPPASLRRRRALAALVLLAAAAPGWGGDSLPRVEELSVRRLGEKTEVLLRLSSRASYRSRLLEAPRVARPTLFLVFDGCAVAPAVKTLFPDALGPVLRVKAAKLGTRVGMVIEMQPGAGYYLAQREEPFTLAITVSPAKAKGEGKAEGPSRPRIEGRLALDAAYRLAKPASWTQLRTTLLLGASGKLSEGASYRVGGRARYDAVYDLTDRYSMDASRDQRWDRELRDAYLDLSRGSWDARLGRQQTVWGESVGLFVADRVDPRDLREFILPEFEQIRIPQWAGQMEWAAEDTHLEGIWLPFPEFDRLPVPGSEFYTPPPAPAGVPVAPERTPARTLDNGTFGVRASRIVAGWDASAFFLRGWDHEPVFYRRAAPGPVPLVLSPEHDRLSTTGGTVSKDLGPAVLKAEAAYDMGRRYEDLDPAASDGVSRHDTLDSMAGLTFSQGRLNADLQVIRRDIFGYRATLVGERRVRAWASLLLKAGLLDGRLEPELLAVEGLGLRDLMLRAKLNLKVGGRWRLSAGADIFDGVPDGLFGRFEDRDRLTAEARLYF